MHRRTGLAVSPALLSKAECLLLAHQRTAFKPPAGLLLKVSPILAYKPDKKSMVSQPAESPKGFRTVWFVCARDASGSGSDNRKKSIGKNYAEAKPKDYLSVD